MVYYLPPYSPDLNPIEEAFSKIKSNLKSQWDRYNMVDVETQLLASFTSISPEDCCGWIAHQGIYNV